MVELWEIFQEKLFSAKNAYLNYYQMHVKSLKYQERGGREGERIGKRETLSIFLHFEKE